MWHFTSWPGLFALVASDILDEVHAGLTLLRSHYKAFLDAQLHMTKSKCLKKVVDASPFQRTVMEDIANLSVAPDHHSNEWRLGRLRSYAKALFSSWGQTKVVEDCFQRMRTREEGDTRSKIHNSLAYWSMSKEMKTIEFHDRDALEPDDLPELMCNETKVPKIVFDAKHHELSVDGTEDIMKTNCWPTFSAQSAQFQYATSVFLDLINHKASSATTDDERKAVWASSSRVWRGVLFSQGMVVKHATSGEYFVCIGFVGNLLVLLWKIEAVKIAKGKVVFAVGTGTNKNTYAISATAVSLDDYDAIPTTIISPTHMHLVDNKRVHDFIGVVFMQTEDPLPIMVWAARNCFWKLKLPELKTLAKELDVAAVTPDLLGLLDILIQTVLPEATREEVNDILMMRCEVGEDPLKELDPDILEALVPPEDFKVFEDAMCISFDIIKYGFNSYISF